MRVTDVATTIGDVEDLIAQFCEAGLTPGVTLRVSTKGCVHSFTTGKESVSSGANLAADARFRIGCIFKLLLTLICLRLEEEGRLSIDDRVAEFLPEDITAPGARHVSIRHLLTHTSGFVEPDVRHRWSLSWEGLLQRFNERAQAFPAGAVWSYCQTGHAIVARIIERVTGEPILATLERRIFRPLGIGDDTGLLTTNCVQSHVWSDRSGRFEPIRTPKDSGVVRWSISDLCMTADEIVRIGEAIVGTCHNADEVASPAVRERLTADAIDIPVSWSPAKLSNFPVAYTLGLASRGDNFSHNGSYLGSTSALQIAPTEGVAIALCMNAWRPILRDRLMDALMICAGCKTSRPTRLRPQGEPSAEVNDLEGEYEPLMMGAESLHVGKGGTLLGGALQGRITAKGGWLGVKSREATSPCWFFRHPVTGEPSIRYGFSAYQQVRRAGVAECPPC